MLLISKKYTLFFMLLGLTVVRNSEENLNDRPIVGILSQEIGPCVKGKQSFIASNNCSSYLAASYVKHIESAGARVAPIMIGKDKVYYEKMVRSVNGVLFPGGGADDFKKRSGYFEAASIIFELASVMNSKGDYFPLWGTCLGFQALTYLTRNSEHRTSCKSSNHVQPLQFVCGFEESRLFGKAPANTIEILGTKNVSGFFHNYCVKESELDKSFWRVLALNRDLEGTEFVSVVEAKRYPYYAVMFHPEKNSYEFKKNRNYPHSYEAVIAGQFFANFFVYETRRNKHSFPSEEAEADALIYNFSPVYSGRKSNFEQVYFFRK